MHARHLTRRAVAVCITATAALLLSAACAPSSTPAGSAAGSGGQGTSQDAGSAGGSGGAASGSAGSAASGSAGSGSAASGSAASSSSSSAADDFSLDDLIAAAKAEGGTLTVYDTSGAIKDIAKNFTAKYGIKVNGVKSKAPDQVEKVTREAQAGNVTVDVMDFDDGATLVNELLPQKIVYSWSPPDLKIREGMTDPQVLITSATVFAYNSEVNPNGCPISNVWQLTTPEWKGRLAMQDPLDKPKFADWMTELSLTQNDALAAAYKDLYGKDLDTSSEDAAHQFIKGLAKNAPILTGSDEDAGAAVGAPGQKNPPMGLISTGKFRDIEDKGYHMAFCKGLEPWGGIAAPKYTVITSGTKHPNAAKLFVHYMLTAEGIEPSVSDNGAQSANADVPQDPKLSPDGLTDWSSQLMFTGQGLDILKKDADMRQDTQDFWRINHQ